MCTHSLFDVGEPPFCGFACGLAPGLAVATAWIVSSRRVRAASDILRVGVTRPASVARSRDLPVRRQFFLCVAASRRHTHVLVRVTSSETRRQRARFRQHIFRRFDSAAARRRRRRGPSASAGERHRCRRRRLMWAGISDAAVPVGRYRWRWPSRSTIAGRVRFYFHYQFSGSVFMR